MRKPRDYDAELKALTDKAKALREDKLRRLGVLVVHLSGFGVEDEGVALVVAGGDGIARQGSEVRHEVAERGGRVNSDRAISGFSA